jgi:flagellar basal body-associated protein FliL
MVEEIPEFEQEAAKNDEKISPVADDQRDVLSYIENEELKQKLVKFKGKSVEDALKSYSELESRFGKVSGIKLAPKSPDEYGNLGLTDEEMQGVTPDQLKILQDDSFKLGLSPEQAQRRIRSQLDAMNESRQASLNAQNQRNLQMETALSEAFKGKNVKEEIDLYREGVRNVIPRLLRMTSEQFLDLVSGKKTMYDPDIVQSINSLTREFKGYKSSSKDINNIYNASSRDPADLLKDKEFHAKVFGKNKDINALNALASVIQNNKRSF